MRWQLHALCPGMNALWLQLLFGCSIVHPSQKCTVQGSASVHIRHSSLTISHLLLADASMEFVPIRNLNAFAGYWLRDHARTTQAPLPLCVLLKQSAFMAKRYETIKGIWVSSCCYNGLHWHLLVSAQLQLVALCH